MPQIQPPAQSQPPSRQQSQKNGQATLEEVRKIFYKLYCYKSTEIERYLKAAARMPQEALDNLYKMLQYAKAHQDALLAKRIENDENFLKDFSHFTETATRKIKQSYEESEAGKADDILKNI